MYCHWHRHRVLTSTHRLNRKFEAAALDVELRHVNFNDSSRSASEINKWLFAHGHIGRLLEPESVASARLHLATAIHFHGEWTFAFDRIDSKVQKEQRYTAMNAGMYSHAGEIVTDNGRAGQWIEVPYARRGLSMIIILPGIKDSLSDLIASLTTDNLLHIFKQLNSPEKEIHLTLPKFNVSNTFSYVESLRKVSIYLIDQ